MLSLNFIKTRGYVRPILSDKPSTVAERISGIVSLAHRDIFDIAYITGLMQEEQYKTIEVFDTLSGQRLMNITLNMNRGISDEGSRFAETFYDSLDYMLGALHGIEDYIRTGVGTFNIDMKQMDKLDAKKLIDIIKDKVRRTVASVNVDVTELTINVFIPDKEYDSIVKPMLDMDEREALKRGGFQAFRYTMHSNSKDVEFNSFYDLPDAMNKSEAQQDHEDLLNKYCDLRAENTDLKDQLEDFGEAYELFRDKRLQELKGTGKEYKEADIKMQFLEALQNKNITVTELKTPEDIDKILLKEGED